jgi:EAL domain-containing protein (putative c-di-GMP-specific phosphodiesterase class I)
VANCETCGTYRSTDLVTEDPGVLVVADDELRRRVRQLLVRAGIECATQGTVLIPSDVAIDRVVALLGDGDRLTEFQQDRIRIYRIDPSSRELGWLGMSTTLGALVTALEMPEVGACLERGDIETHFQPIVGVQAHQIVGYEALSRGRDLRGEIITPYQLFSYAQQTDSIFYLDRLARETAIRSAAKVDLEGRLFINFLPNAIYDPRQCLKTTLAIANACGFDPSRIVFEVSESEQIVDFSHLKTIFRYYRSHGFQVALDDVGSGYAGLNTLIELVPDVIKLDRDLIHDIDQRRFQRAIAAGVITAARGEGIEVVAEGVETVAELSCVVDLGVTLIQGFVFAKPAADPIRSIEWPGAV